MKKTIGIISSILMIAALLTAFAGCSKKEEAQPAPEPVAVTSGKALSSFASADDVTGTEFTVASVEDLVKLSEFVAAGEDFSGCSIKQIADIDMNPGLPVLDESKNFIGDDAKLFNFKPIGNNTDDSAIFSGTYDGNGKVIRGLYINIKEKKKGIGLFGKTVEAVIRNVTLVEAYITVDESMKAKDLSRHGSIIGLALDTTVEGCYSDAFVNGPWLGPKGADAVNEEHPELNLVPNAQGDDCYGSEYIGGIVGRDDGESIIRNCVFAGKLYDAYGSCGGIIGRGGDSEVSNCLVTGKVECPSGSAAINGKASGEGNYAVENAASDMNDAEIISASQISAYANTVKIGGYDVLKMK